MGCDIHIYVEYSTFPNTEDEPYWQNLMSTNPGRDYAMFGVLAGVRTDQFTLFQPRGIPDGKMSYQTEDDFWLRVSDEHADVDGYTSLSSAQDWAQEYGTEVVRDSEDRLQKVSNPDWHSHSWLTLAELQQALAHYMFEVGRPYNIEWDAILAAMRSLEERGAKTRIIFWFDN